MRILIVTPSYFPIVGGSEVLTRTLSVKLNEIGIHTDIMTFNMNKKWHPVWREEIEENGTCKIFRVPATKPFGASSINLLYPLLRTNVIPRLSFRKKFEQYDIIHFLGEADLSFPFFSCFVKKPKLMHCVATFSLFEHYNRFSLLRKPSRHLFAHFADSYIVSSDEEKKLLYDLGIHRSKIFTLPIGVDANAFHPDETKKLDNLLLFIGRIDRTKGLHILMKALSYIRIPTQLVIIGPRWSTKYVGEIEQMSRKTNENGVHRVRLLEAMSPNRLVSWYQRATIVVCPYLLEPFSNITREALACGTPVVSTGKHIVRNGDDGILVTPEEPEKVANALTKFLEDKEMTKEYGEQGRRIVEQHFTWKSVINNYAKLYMDILDAKSS